jgi:hypothetical protein
MVHGTVCPIEISIVKQNDPDKTQEEVSPPILMKIGIDLGPTLGLHKIDPNPHHTEDYHSKQRILDLMEKLFLLRNSVLLDPAVVESIVKKFPEDKKCTSRHQKVSQTKECHPDCEDDKSFRPFKFHYPATSILNIPSLGHTLSPPGTLNSRKSIVSKVQKAIKLSTAFFS